MLYPTSKAPALDGAVFANPPREYRGAPFWAWNADMTPEMLVEQIDILKEMGLGGFHMHSRSGMAVPYLSDRFMNLVKACVDKARKEGMRAYLYDEDRWPSGAAGGLVTKDIQYRARVLRFTASRRADLELIAGYAIELDQNGCIAAYRRLSDGESAKPGEIQRYAYLEIQPPSSWYNNEAYLDTLNPAAVKRFIDVTHERYAQCVGDDFGGVVPSIFTDEPQFSRKRMLGFADSEDDAVLPWTNDFPGTYQAEYGEDPLSKLPELFYDLPGGAPSSTRYQYHAHISDRFAQAFADQIGQWCGKHGLALTGHMMEEPTLLSQTEALGEVMRSLAAFQIPGIDMLCDRYEYTTAKQASSIARQYGRDGVLSELYGVTGWHYDFRGHKLQGDWQAALGVTLRVHHLSWVSMRGAAKRDYPASIFYQSPWYKEYPIIEDHFARVNAALTRGKPLCRVAVIHPVETYWLLYGPMEQSHEKREELDRQFQTLTAGLLNGLIDFDYISEALLPGQAKNIGGKTLDVGEMSYDAVLAPNMRTMRSGTVDILAAFKDAGGALFFVGEAPTLENAKESERVKALACGAKRLPMSMPPILEALEPYRFADVRDERGVRPESLVYQAREDEDARWLFIANGAAPLNPDVPIGKRLTIRVKGLWTVEEYDTQTGDIRPIGARRRGGETRIDARWFDHTSILLRLTPGSAEDSPITAAAAWSAPAKPNLVWETARVKLSEPNVLLMDKAEYKLDNGEWEPLTELLRIEKAVRERVNYPNRSGQLAQPWLSPELPRFEHYVTMRFPISNDIHLKDLKLAIESPGLCRISLDGDLIEAKPDGWWVDKSIETIPLPEMKIGRHTLEVVAPIGLRTGLEWCYLLGDFGVKLQGAYRKLVAPVRELGFGDWSSQGLPFYAGNVTYELPLHLTRNARVTLEIPQYRNPLLSVGLNNEPVGRIIYAPYTLEMDVQAGSHIITVTAYGNRANAFGAVHNSNPAEHWHGPSAWESTGDSWSEEYRLWPTGVLVSPKAYW
ncbi:MAG: hypothetical protein LBH66_02675 [Oscillospiraceae bacterium]|jgi:hypothetical protein|nr:hypothetical protein [Oscillospiraceae bacterium]